MTVVVLSVLIELPMVLDMLPEPARRGLLIAALLTPDCQHLEAPQRP